MPLVEAETLIERTDSLSFSFVSLKQPHSVPVIVAQLSNRFLISCR